MNSKVLYIQNLQRYINENNLNEVLVLYSVANFMND